MTIQIREYEKTDVNEAVKIWNQVVEDGEAFPQMEFLTEKSGDEFFREQSFTGIAYDEETGETAGLYILHPNNIGRCGHICNASYAVKKGMRGHHIGEKLVIHCMRKGKELGFRILQFNAVVASNRYALRLYEKLGFVRLGTIPGGFLMKDGHYEDIIPHYHVL
ncbi:MAG TPA: GNAT family N-acetyltransferase [Candidatus Mediterraneibacter intestinigallinarum]|nr:GNAT family N-acetyltransferase [Candidatus Mediterraneibacter intestinigallinarum]